MIMIIDTLTPWIACILYVFWGLNTSPFKPLGLQSVIIFKAYKMQTSTVKKRNGEKRFIQIASYTPLPL